MRVDSHRFLFLLLVLLGWPPRRVGWTDIPFGVNRSTDYTGRVAEVLAPQTVWEKGQG